MDLKFVSRTELGDREWDNQAEKWERPEIDPDVLRQLNKRSSFEGFVRLVVHAGCIFATGWLAMYVSQYNILFAVVPFLLYAFLVGFLNGIEHEMRHQIVFPRSLNWFSDLAYFLIHVLLKSGPIYQRASHRIHHRYTMVKGIDPETDFPEKITTKWVRKVLRGLAFTVLTVGVISFFKLMWTLIQRTLGNVHPKVKARCGERDFNAIRRESLVILLINVLGLVALIWFQQWELLVLLIFGPPVGSAIVAFYHLTEHIGMMYDGNDQRLCTRGVKVNPIVKFFYGGLDEHVEHHIFPAVPSRNLSKLREALDWAIPERRNVIQCWREIYAIAQHKENHPGHEFVPAY